MREIMYSEYDGPADVEVGSAVCWMERYDGDDPHELLKLVIADLRDLGYLTDDDSVALSAVPVLMRLQSEVEGRISGFEGEPMMVECTARAKRPLPHWRIERTA